jgi:DNA-binding transcriptional MerR regulator
MPLQASRKSARKSPVAGPVIPDRLYFRIGDVARICGVETYVLRFWETQFPQLRPNKSGTGQRLYRRRDVELALEIKRLVHGDGYTLAGARAALAAAPSRRSAARAEPSPDSGMTAPPAIGDAAKATLARVKSELREIADLLAQPQPTARRERAKVLKVRPESDSLFPI